MKITLLGYMGAGKSTVSRHLAAELQLPLIDLDKRIENESGKSITETIFNKGELHFRKLERRLLEEALKEESFVLSTGGGTPCYYDNLALINRNSFSVYLQYSVIELYERLEGQQAERPLIAHLKGDQLKEFVAKHLFERAPFYEGATEIIRAGNRPLNEIVNEIKAMIHE